MYGKVFEDNSPTFKAGINDFDNVKFLGLVNIDTAGYTGPVMDLVLVKDGSEYRDRMFPINPDSVKPRNTYDREMKANRMETMEEAVKRAYGDFNSRVKHIFTNFISEEEFASVQAESFEDYINQLTDLLPDGYDTLPGQVILGYGNSGKYLEMPKYMWITGHFLSIQGKKDLKVSDRVKTVKVSEVAESAPKEVTW